MVLDLGTQHDAAQALSCLRKMGVVSAMLEMPSELDEPALRDAAYQSQAMENQAASQLKLASRIIWAAARRKIPSLPASG